MNANDTHPAIAPPAKAERVPDWLRYGAIALIILGIMFRIVNLDQKVYWTDEALTSLRASGHTRTEFVREVFTGAVVSPDTIQRYQRPETRQGWAGTPAALMGNAEHAPLYFVLTRFWMNWFGSSVAAVRSLPAVFGLLALPCAVWLGQELFASPRLTWMVVGLFAVTPLHVLYAQEARPYSLWTVCILASGALLLRAVRLNTSTSWLLYALSLAVGLYTQLLFVLVAIAHALYIALTAPLWVKGQVGAIARSYLLAAGAALLSFVPWLLLLIHNSERVEDATDALNSVTSFTELINRWFLGISRSFVGEDLGSANSLMVALTIYALYVLWRTTETRIWLFVVLLVAVPFLALALPDVLLGGSRTLRIRYLIPSYIGLQLALAYWFGTQAVQVRTWGQKACRVGLVALLTAAIIGCTVSAQADVWWNKGNSRSSYYIPVAALINRTKAPLVIADRNPSELLAFSRRLAPHVRLQITQQPSTLTVADGFSPVFLLNPSDKLRRAFQSRGYQLKLVYRDRYAPRGEDQRLWRVKI
jgi:uncharacterized membrane protein